MTGLPEFNYPAFNVEAARLRRMGYHVENPAENPAPPCGSHTAYMRLSLAQLLTCTHVATLPNWRRSKGALIEVRLAHQLGLEIARASRMESLNG